MPKAVDAISAKKHAAKLLAGHFLANPQVSILARHDVNTTFLAKDEKDKLIIRIADKETLGRQHLNEYQRAAKASELVSAIGIRTRQMLLTGDSLVPYAYQVSEFINGQTGEEYQGHELAIWEQIGRLAKQVNSIKTEGFGDEPFHKPSTSWRDYITRHISGIMKFQSNPKNERVAQKVRFTSAEIKRLEKLLQPLKDIKPDLRLIHGDLGPHNVIVDNQGKVIAVIDWDLAKSFPAEHQIGLSTFWNSYQQPEAAARRGAFLKGYGSNFDHRLVSAFQIYEYLTQLPFHSHQEAAKDIIGLLAGLHDLSPKEEPVLFHELASRPI
jgi:Ser/Thr protein kinase RdoA (MazF antagonist)